MRSLLEKFRELDISKSSIGLDGTGNNNTYFCTPMGAEIIGWLGVEGIHFCFIPSVDADMVFAISPMPCGKHYVEPIAKNFLDFMGLILSCGDSSTLESVSWISEADFIELLEINAENSIDGKAEAIHEIQSAFGIEKLIEPYRYIRSIQEGFNYSSIPYSDEYYDITGLERP